MTARSKVVAERGRRAPVSTSKSDATRQRMIEAALEAIYEYGFRHATSNKIAAHAGVTWGVIQYHFGTRERLLLAVLQTSIDGIEQRIEAINSTLPGATLDERFDAWESLVFESFGYKLFPGVVQIALDLGRDPSVGDDTIAQLKRYQSTIRRLRQLAAQLGETPLPADLADYIYWSSWSAALAESMTEFLQDTDEDHAARRRLALRAATTALVQHTHYASKFRL